jgi:hypothetical protein
MTAQYTYLLIFMCLSYLILTDANVLRFIELLLQLIRVQYLKAKWWIQYNPTNPIVRYLMWRGSLKLAKELQEEFFKNPTHSDEDS